MSDAARGGDNGAVAALADIVFDCARPASLARFWAAALDGYEVAPYDDDELARLRSVGITDVEDDPTVLVQRRAGDGPRLWFQLVPEPKRVKNRVHLDLAATMWMLRSTGCSASARPGARCDQTRRGPGRAAGSRRQRVLPPPAVSRAAVLGRGVVPGTPVASIGMWQLSLT